MTGWWAKWQRRSRWPVEMQMARLRQQILEDARWMAHDPKVAAICDRYERMSASDWMHNAVENVPAFRRRIGAEPSYSKAAPQADMPGVPLSVIREAIQPAPQTDYKALYDEAMTASNAAGFVGMTAAQTIQALDEERTQAESAQPAAPLSYADAMALEATPCDGQTMFTVDEVESIVKLKVAVAIQKRRQFTEDGPVFHKLVDDLWDQAEAASTVPGVQRRHFARAIERALAAAQPVACKSIHFKDHHCVQHLCGKTCFREMNDTIAQPAVQPVAWLIERSHKVYGTDLRESFGSFYSNTKAVADEYAEKGWTVTPLYAAPVAAQPTDAQMLDWMISRGARISWGNDGEVCNVWLPAERDGTEERPAEGYPQKGYYDPREAIRAAMASATPQQNPPLPCPMLGGACTYPNCGHFLE